jgi:hypothetical protein
LFSLDDCRAMTNTTILLAVFGAMLVAAYALWDLGAPNRILASFGRFIVRTITFGRIQIASETDEATAMAISTTTLLAIFVSFLIISSRVH